MAEVKLTRPTDEGHFRPVGAYRTEYEQYEQELARGPRLGILTRLRLWIVELTPSAGSRRAQPCED